ncbi:MAG: hypothetical protein KQ78_00217 [Candidatus Izimaplasma bacterium HR2]|nr:MAG: hypothetical protein KQ78_00217 [Candidatus Izimaplasma bacterium HR2]
MDFFKTIDDLDPSKYHKKFKFIKDDLSEYKYIINNWAKDFVDRDNKIVKEFQTTFHSVFWELFLYRVFVDCGLEIDFTQQVPDFIIKGENRFYVEAVVANIKHSGQPEEARNFKDVIESLNPPWLLNDYSTLINESIVRCSNALTSKKNKYVNSYKSKEHVKDDAPFLVALASYDDINYGKEYYYAMLSLLYGYSFDIESKSFSKISEVEKIGSDSKIDVNLFNKSDFKDVAAVIFSSSLTIGKLVSLHISSGEYSNNNVYLIRDTHSNDNQVQYLFQEVKSDNEEQLTDGLFVFHNPNACVPFDSSIFDNSNITVVREVNNSLEIDAKNEPTIVRRLNIAKPIANQSVVQDRFALLMDEWNK